MNANKEIDVSYVSSVGFGRRPFTSAAASPPAQTQPTQSGSHKYEQEARPYEDKVRVSEEDLRALHARPPATGREHVRPEGP